MKFVVCVSSFQKAGTIYSLSVSFQRVFGSRYCIDVGCREVLGVGILDFEIEWAIKNIKGKSLLSLILRAAWNAYIYHIWRERNGRVHK